MPNLGPPMKFSNSLAADLNIPPGSGGPWPGIEPGLFLRARHDRFGPSCWPATAKGIFRSVLTDQFRTAYDPFETIRLQTVPPDVRRHRGSGIRSNSPASFDWP